MPAFQPVMSVEELPQEGLKAVEADGKSYLVGRIQGQLVACLDRCPHAGKPLKIGKVRGEEIKCAWHGWTFNLLSGQSIPGNPAFQLTQIPVKIDGSQVYIAV